jgi:hypothetical protein
VWPPRRLLGGKHLKPHQTKPQLAPVLFVIGTTSHRSASACTAPPQFCGAPHSSRTTFVAGQHSAPVTASRCAPYWRQVPIRCSRRGIDCLLSSQPHALEHGGVALHNSAHLLQLPRLSHFQPPTTPRRSHRRPARCSLRLLADPFDSRLSTCPGPDRVEGRTPRSCTRTPSETSGASQTQSWLARGSRFTWSTGEDGALA